jgi:N-sulfoglucosamine sulfohydrolase
MHNPGREPKICSAGFQTCCIADFQIGMLQAHTLKFLFPALTILFVVVSLASAAQTNSPSQPNILFCFADDWAYPHAGAYGDTVVQTPNFDRVASEGILFTHAFSATPSCTASRAAICTGQAPHRLEESGNLWSTLQRKFPVYPNLLEKSGYVVGLQGKGWGPGDFKAAGRTRNPAGPNFPSFAQFIKTVPADKPFCFWYGSHDPHRAYKKDSGIESGLKPEQVTVPPYFPDTLEVRKDILDYYFAVQRFDRNVGEILKLLEETGRATNTLVVISGDNGWPFPRGKANLYDAGTRQPLAIRWLGKIAGGQTNHAFVNLTDLALTFLEAAGLKPHPDMTGQSLMPLLEGKKQSGRDAVFVERERHANSRAGDLSYPARAIRTDEFLYIRNLRPDRWPAGDPKKWVAVGPFGDCDAGPTKDFILDHRDESRFQKFFQLAFEKRPAEELYDLSKDPYQLINVADQKNYADAKKKLRARLDDWMKSTKDPRATSEGDPWDHYTYYGTAN